MKSSKVVISVLAIALVAVTSVWVYQMGTATDMQAAILTNTFSNLTVTGEFRADNNRWGTTSAAAIISEVEGLKSLTCPAGTYLMNLTYTTDTASNNIISISGGNCAKL